VASIQSGKYLPKELRQVGNVPIFGSNGIIGSTEIPAFDDPVVVVGRVGACGAVAKTSGPAHVSDNALVVRPKSSDLLLGYLYLWLQTVDFDPLVQGTTQPMIRGGDVKNLSIPLPPVDEQRRISSALGALDDLFEVNRKLIEDLVHLRRCLYEQGISGAATSTTVGSIATFENKRRVPLSAAERLANPGTFPYYGATGQMDSVGGYLFDGVRVLVGEDGSVVRADGTPFVQFVDGRYWVNNHAHVLVGQGISTELLRVILECASVASVVTGAVQPKLSMGNLKSVSVLVPTDPAIDSAIQALASAELGLRQENGQLEATRGDLLPLLISGRVRVGDVAA
jgi:type I restriction enzyme S subunit